MHPHIKSALKFLLFLGLGSLILYFLYQSQNAKYLEDCQLKGIPLSDCSLVDKVIQDFKSTKISWLALICFLFMLSNVFRALRWKDMVQSIGFKPKVSNVFFSIMIGYLANLTIPRIGEIARAGVMTKYEKIAFETSFGSIITERLVDVLMLLLFMVLMAIFGGPTIINYIAENSVVTQNQLFIAAGVGFLLFVIGLWVLKKMTEMDSESKFVRFIKEKSTGFLEGLKTVIHTEKKLLFWAYSFGIWILYFLMTYLCFYAFEPTSHLGIKAGLVTFVFGTLGIVFPSPGGLGSYHFMVSQALILFSINSSDAFSFAFIIFFTVVVFCNVFFGLISLLMIQFVNADK